MKDEGERYSTRMNTSLDTNLSYGAELGAFGVGEKNTFHCFFSTLNSVP